MAAVHDLTQAGCMRLNAAMGDLDEPPAGIVCRSVGSRLVKATHGKFPLNFTYPLVAWFDGPNDGLVARDSFPWGRTVHLVGADRTARHLACRYDRSEP